MSNMKLLFILFVVALPTLAVRARDSVDRDTEHVRFYELKKGNLRVNFTNFGARIVSLNVPDKFGNVADIVLGYDSVDAYKEDKYSFGAIVGRVSNRSGKREDKINSKDDNDETEGLSNVIWKVLKHGKSAKIPFITFQYDSHDDDEEGFPGNLIVTATYLLRAKNKLQLTLSVEAKNEAASLNLGQNTYWNLGGHNSSGNILHSHLRILASKYRKLDDKSIPTGRTLPVNNTPYDFQRYHPIQSRFQKLKNGYHVEYFLDHQADRNAKNGVELAAVLRDKKSGRVMKVWTDQGLVQFRTGDEVRNIRGKAGVLYQKNSGLVLSAYGYRDSEDSEDDDGDFSSLIVRKEKPYNQTTVFQFLVKKRLS